MHLKEDKIVLRTATPTDADILLAWWNDGVVMAHAGFPNGLGTTKDKVLDNIAWNDSGRELIILEYNGVPIGELNYRSTESGAPEIGIKICAAEKQEQGIGTHALQMLIRYLFEEKKYPEILVSTNLNNLRAQHVYEKVGFKKIGVDYNAWTDESGIQHSSVNYQLTREGN